MDRATVEYQVATYSGEIVVFCDENDDNECIEARARRQLVSRAGPLPFGYESFRVMRREPVREAAQP
jgi:hypothetical protein